MPQIAIDNETYERLQRHAKPFVDTPEMVINLALDALDGAQGIVFHENEKAASGQAAPGPEVSPCAPRGWNASRTRRT